MGSQQDLDQGGTSRQWLKEYMGPSVGWKDTPLRNIVEITVGGTYNIDPSTNLVRVNTTGAVTLVLPSAANPAASFSQQNLFARNAITVVDVGGHAGLSPITIQRNNPADNIMGAPSLTLSVNYSTITLLP